MESSDSFDMISGTNGLLGASDGAFVMQKEKRTDNKAVLEVTGRDQQDQKLWLNFNRERCVWELTKTETELWKEPEDPLLEKIKELVTEIQPEWTGTATASPTSTACRSPEPCIKGSKIWNVSAYSCLIVPSISNPHPTSFLTTEVDFPKA